MRVADMGSSEAQRRASRKYNAEKTFRFTITLNKKYDADIIQKLDSVDSKPQYVRSLIRADIARSQEQE